MINKKTYNKIRSHSKHKHQKGDVLKWLEWKLNDENNKLNNKPRMEFK